MNDLALPFAHLNLRRNPFGELDPAERVEVAVVDLGPHLLFLSRPGRVVQFLGDCGAGKSTHLLAIAARRPKARYVRVDRGDGIPDSAMLILDEVQWLPRHERLDLFAARRVLAIGSHEDLEDELTMTGLETSTVRLEVVSPERLRSIVGQRIEYARRGPGPVPAIDDAALEQLIRRHGTDVRAMESDLYEAFQRLTGVNDTMTLP